MAANLNESRIYHVKKTSDWRRMNQSKYTSYAQIMARQFNSVHKYPLYQN